jgi:leucyl-tRNA synthetase
MGQHDEQLLVEDETELVLQVNGKSYGIDWKLPAHTEAEVKTAALGSPKIKVLIAGKTVRNVIVVPKKLVNIVV